MTASPRPLLVGFILAVVVAAGASAEEAYQSYQRGIEALGSGDCRKAAQAFEEAIAKDDRENKSKRAYGMTFIEYFPHFNLARAYHCLGQYDKALEHLRTSESQRAVKARDIAPLKAELEKRINAPAVPATPTPDPRLARVREAVAAGDAAMRNDDLAGAIKAYRDALADDPQNAVAKAGLDSALKAQRVEGLVAEGRKAFGRGDFKTARARATDALKLDARHADARKLAGQADAELARLATPTPPPSEGPRETARRMAQEELSQGRTAAGRGDWDGAVSHLQEAKRLDPTDVAIIKELASAQQRRSDVEQVKRAAAAVEEARRMLANGDLVGARNRASQAAAWDPRNEDARLLLQDIGRELVSTPTPPPTAAATAAEGIDKRPLHDGVRAFYAGRYDDALAVLSRASSDVQGMPVFQLYLGASYLAKYLLAGEQEARLRDSANAAFRKAHQLDPSFQPDPRAISPRILDAYRTAL